MVDSATPLTIGVFDSGLGGLSIMAAIRNCLPQLNLAYCCDNLNFPYGTKTEDDVVAAATRTTTLFSQTTHLDALVIACNTASVVALEAVRRNLSIPVVGVVPAVKPAAIATKTKIIGILATPVTIGRPYLENLIKTFAPECRVVKVGSSRLVVLAEQKIRRSHAGVVGLDLEEIRLEVQEIIDAAKVGLDQLVLGCTHFPLLANELRQVLPASVTLVDSGFAVASRVKAVIEEYYGFCPEGAAEGGRQLHGFCSGEPFEIGLPSDFFGVGQKFELQKLK